MSPSSITRFNSSETQRSQTPSTNSCPNHHLWLTHNTFLSNSLMNAYVYCGLLADAKQIFHHTPCKNVVSWTILISGLAKNDCFVEAIDVFREMIMGNFKPNAVTISSVLPAFANLGLIRIAKSVHCFWVRGGFEGNVFVETALVDMYSKFGCMGVARQLFESMSERNVVSWNAIVSGYSDHGFSEEAIDLFNLMRRKGLLVDFYTIMSLIPASLSVGCLQVGTGIHGFIIRTGYENDKHIKTALMDIYAFSSGRHWDRAIKHFNKMLGIQNLKLDSIALMGILSSCSHSGALQQDMYANCGNLEDAKRFFLWDGEKDVVCWNAMIAGNGMNGYGTDAIDLFLQMKGSGLDPDESTFVSVLYACSHAGMVYEGLQIFSYMVKTSHVIPNLQHYACVIDILGRAGQLDAAYSFINNMPFQPDFDVYSTLLGACRIHGNIKLGHEISQKIFEMEPNDAGYYVLLSNMYALAGNWEGVKMTRASLRSKRMKKDPGFSSIEINQEIYTFMAGEKDHPQYFKIEGILKGLILKIKKAGYVPNTNVLLQDVSDDMKKDILYHHSEKMAIAFGLMRTKPGTIIRITKNLRTCDDCHTASKFVSKVFGRVLVIKDANRFHVFQDGVCSCRDY
ncbi:Pentatricopeptide repeat-containing protein, chloroplastic [Vitis vinifera]|uniref:Pentatricopeptide repeat-containing protein, chloroplastic n=1 Tax=Vitis vinifera TaxID=29760 RepID=A0A438FMY1_VITVI|nr:Pentatricopeptide repeat-containing protein, chloroplastic [Vitis vinifera]